MQELKIVIALNPVSKKNSQRIVQTRDGRPFIIPSKAYAKYEKEAGKYLAPLRKPHIDYPVNVKCLFYMETRRRVDLSNLIEACDDVLVKYGILEDDNYRIVAGHDGSRILHDKSFPRTEIYISKMEG